MTFGNVMLYFGFILVSLFVVLVELAIRKPKKYSFENVRQLSKINAVIFASLLSYLSYLFLLPDFTTDAVWRYTEKNAPTIFKISGIWAGQEGTYLFWAAFSVMFIYLHLMLSGKKGTIDRLVLRTAQLAALSSLFLIAMTMFASPFDSIYDYDPELPTFYVPSDGNSLNPALLNLLMVIHPPVIFVAYAFLIIPFAASFCFFVRNRKKEISKWIEIVRPWLRYSWLFLTISLSLGGLWAYVILGWGGFWAWDPVETSSLLPWLLLTAVLHLLYRMNDKRTMFSTLAPSLTIFSFILVLYSAFITRSSLWGSIHSFESVALSVSVKLLLVFMIISTILCIYFTFKRLLTKIKTSSLNKTFDSELNLDADTSFYMMAAFFILLVFISLFGLTYPFVYELFSPQKLATSIEFYNLWSYVFLVPLILFTGYGMSLSLPETRKNMIFKNVLYLTILFAFISPGNNLTILDTSGLFYMTASPIYKIIGNISLLSMAPPLIYLFFIVTLRIKSQLKLYSEKKQKTKNDNIFFIRKISVSVIHMAVFLIIFSLMFSSFVTSFDTSVKIEKGSSSNELIFADKFGTDNYSIILLDYKKNTLVDKKYYDDYASLKDIISNPYAYPDTITIYGLVSEVKHVSSYTYIKITDNNQYLWIATTKGAYHKGDYMIAKGSLFYDFKSPTTGILYDFILFSDETKITKTDLKNTQEQLVFDVYKDGKKITKNGVIDTHNKYGGEVKVLVDRHILYDVYVTFNGASDTDIFLSVKILPLVNFMWFGVFLLIISMTAIIISNRIMPTNKSKIINKQITLNTLKNQTKNQKNNASKKQQKKQSSSKNSKIISKSNLR